MNEAEFATHWKKVVEMLVERADSPQSEKTFDTLWPIYHDDERIVMRVDDYFMLAMMRNRYSLMVGNAIMISFGREYEVVFIGKNEEYQPPEEEETIPATALNPKYTFDSFVVGNSNRFAHAASLAVARLPSTAYNPLFIYGGVGLGKTHLMQAIGNELIAKKNGFKALYITSERFTNQLIEAIGRNTNKEFRERFRGVDALLIDDIQFIAGKTRTQEEFFHTFNELRDGGKQIVITSDRPPKEIPTLEERLRSRFEWGLIADIAKPDFETRVAILNNKAEMEHIPVDQDVLHYIAEKCVSNIRELEGALTRVNAIASLNGEIISMKYAEQAFGSIIAKREKRMLTPELIIKTVATYYNIQPSDILSERRSREIVMPRQVAMYLMSEVAGMSTLQVGKALARDHSTIISGLKRVKAELEKNEHMKAALDELKHTIEYA